MKSAQILAALCVLGSVSAARADVFLNFEDLPIVYNADYGAIFGDIDGYYAPEGVIFGQNVQGTGGTSQLPVIGNVGIANQFLSTFSGATTLNFSLTGALGAPGAGVTGISFWYSSLAGMQVTAYDSMGNVINTAFAAATNPTLSNNTSPELFSLAGAGISTVVIDDGGNLGGSYDIDNLTIFATNVPDASNSLGLLALAGAGLLAFRRKTVVA